MKLSKKLKESSTVKDPAIQRSTSVVEAPPAHQSFKQGHILLKFVIPQPLMQELLIKRRSQIKLTKEGWVG